MNKEVISLKEVKSFQTRSEEFFPINWYKEMLHHNPVYFNEETNTWHVFKYEDVKEVLSNYEFFSSEGSRTTIPVGAKNKEGSIPDAVNVTMVDPPNHRKRRSLLSAAFTPRSLKNWEPRIERIAAELVEDIEGNSTVDIVQALAAPLPSMVITELFGVPIEDQSKFKHWVDILFQPFDKENQEEMELKKQAAAKEYYEYLYPIVVEKRSNPSEDIISDLINAEVEGQKFTDDEIVRTTMAILGAGVETTSHALANTFYSLLYDDPSLYEELRNDVELVPKTVEEMLRYRFQSSKRDRTVKKDNSLLGHELKEGDVVVAWMSAANMDGDMFDDPFSLNIHRSNNKKHLTFGKGPHFCLGAPLARLELTTALRTFLQKFSRIEPVESFDLEKSLTTSAPGQSLTQLPIKVYK
ncbi:cytochrome P450 [Halobacillus naozhouensis]|uniref:Cytochrome P450 n=1 Tax=Halobacillus naozhouensis TaxID=554880 RepID=A0ABY8J5W1_9BACI|nr:cytochrome P450 [Halobacillus naozhouensis]WFT76346.1 cytochrome P450 [Halobacillus naozhouensis]